MPDKTCSLCLDVKPESSFSPLFDGRLNARCKVCRAQAEKERKARLSPEGREDLLRRKREAYDRDREAIAMRRKSAHLARTPGQVEADRAYHTDRYRSNPGRALQMRCATHGITVEEFRRWWIQQAGACGSCGCSFSSESDAKIDHDHSCCPAKRSCRECFRGLLCGQCNLLIGHAREDCDILAAACEYLTRWRERP